IPPLLAGRDVVGQSRTGSGKTIAYGLPLIERIDPRLRRMQALVLVPTRELAGQVAGVLLSLGASRGLRVAQLIGGRSYLPQREALRMGAQIAVGAPGRVLDHLRQGTLDLSNLTFAVLDEADQMLDAGFAPDVERLLSAMPAERQLALFTATLPEMTTQIARRYLHEPVSVDAGEPESRPAPSITQIAYPVPRELRLHALMTLLDRRRHASGTTLVFGRTKHGVDKLARQLVARGYPVAALHGNMSQNARDRVLTDFRSGKAPMLLATNVAARGLDVLSIEQVINYELPESAELFTHRVGRTGRMDNTGEAITLLTPDDMAAWRRFQRDLSMKVKPQPWPLDETLAAAGASTGAPAQPIAAATSDTPAVVATSAQDEPEQTERRGERRGERPTERRGERRPERRGMNGERRFEREFERGQEVGERGQARRPFTEEERPTRRADVAARWTRPATESERQDDYREHRERRSEGAHSDRREDTRRERRDDTRFDGRRDDTRRDNARFEGRRDDYRERRFSGERDIRRDDRRGSARDERRDEARRPASPRRATGGFRAAEGGAPRRPARARGFRSARG
ncbi:MAG TPA: DEAD/DEAH box helicase, partial [Ideonella sp.]|nr:DEAD/DEAH box helicase [Ideonella sp.]